MANEGEAITPEELDYIAKCLREGFVFVDDTWETLAGACQRAAFTIRDLQKRAVPSGTYNLAWARDHVHRHISESPGGRWEWWIEAYKAPGHEDTIAEGYADDLESAMSAIRAAEEADDA